MKTMSRVRTILFLAMAVLVITAIPAVALAAVPTVNLGTTAGFAVLGGTTITNTGPTTITGDVGLHPGSAFVSTGVTLLGASHINDAVAIQAKTDLVAAYNDAAGRSVTAAVPVELGGLTLTSGVYSSGGALGLTGELTLDGQGDPDAVFIFQSTSTLITAANSQITLINGARFCRVFWVVPSSATLGTGTDFVGHIFALTDINVQTGATVEGQLLARNGQVVLDTNVITNDICDVARAINITKVASPTSLPAGGGRVTYSYAVTNPGTVELSNVSVTDNKVSPVTYVSGDVNTDNVLQPGETWLYTSTAILTASITNIGTAVGTGASVVVSDTATAMVTVAGRRLPDTSTPWSNVLLAGFVLMFIGVIGWTVNRNHA